LRHPAPRKKHGQIADWRKYLVIPIAALRVVRCLLPLDHLFAFLDDAFGKPGDERLCGLNESKDLRPLHG